MSHQHDFELAVYAHVDGPQPTGARFTAFHVRRLKLTGGKERVESLPMIFSGSSIEQVKAAAEASMQERIELAHKRDANLREAAKKRTEKRAVAVPVLHDANELELSSEEAPSDV